MDINSSIKLNSGVSVPVLGLGTYLSKAGKEAQLAVSYALEIGYRHIDTASIYGNERDVGIAIRNSHVPRKNVFITTKIWNTEQGYDNALDAIELSLDRMNLEYVDLLLIHWPLTDTRKETWRALETIHNEGLARAIGVSNYTIAHLKEMLDYCKVVPAVNQVELSPFLQQRELLQYCKKYKISVEAYSPLVRAKKMQHKGLLSLSEKYKKTPAQILIRWALQIGTIVLPKSAHEERIKENANVFDFEISQEDMVFMESFDENFRIAWDPSTIP